MLALARPEQQRLDLGAPEHFQLLHGRHQHAVAVCTSAPGQKWQERVYSHATAATMAQQLAADASLNVYQSTSGFKLGRRTIAEVAALPATFVDLDFYRIPKLASLNVGAVLDLSLIHISEPTRPY